MRHTLHTHKNDVMNSQRAKIICDNRVFTNDIIHQFTGKYSDSALLYMHGCDRMTEVFELDS